MVRYVARRVGALPWQLLVVLALVGGSVALRFGGLYSDIALLYDRDHLWARPIPYIDYPNEYPVGIGLLSWAVSHLSVDRTGYLLVTTAVLLVAAFAITILGRRFVGARPWLFALSPALLWYGALNWDLLAIALLVAALLLLRRGRDTLGGFVLALAVWTKFFPIVVVPLVILDRLLRRRWRDAALFGASFGAVSAAINAPFALNFSGGGVQIRAGWARFFTFNQARSQEANLWSLLDWGGIRLDTATINTLSEVLLILGVAATCALLWVARRRVADPAVDLLPPAATMLLGWWLFINKVYSPQYSLWLVALLALIGAARWLAVAFAVADTAWFVAILLAIADRGWSGWMNAPLLLPPLALRELAILLVIGWSANRLLRAGRTALTRATARLAVSTGPTAALRAAE